MTEFEIKYYDADHGGDYVVFTRAEFFTGTWEEANKHVENQKSPWGFNYTVAEHLGHGRAVITALPDGVLEKRVEIQKLKKEINELMGN